LGADKKESDNEIFTILLSIQTLVAVRTFGHPNFGAAQTHPFL